MAAGAAAMLNAPSAEKERKLRTEGKNWENIIRHFLSVTHPHTLALTHAHTSKHNVMQLFYLIGN